MIFKDKIFKMFKKTLILIVIFLITIISIKNNDSNKLWIKDKLLSKNISFMHIKSIYNKYLGDIIPFNKYTDVMAFNEKLDYTDIKEYKDGACLSVIYNYLIPVQYSGIVVFVGDKEGYNNTVIIESDDISIWYSNIEISQVKLYDYFDKGEYLSTTLDDKLYLVFERDGKKVDYKNYI